MEDANRVKIVKWLIVGSLCAFCSSVWVRGDAASDLYNQGVNSLDNQQYDQAAQAFASVINGYPKFPQLDEAHILAGQAYLLGGKFPQAIAILQREADPTGRPAYCAQALFFTALAQFSAAQKNTTPEKVDASGFVAGIATLNSLMAFVAANPTPENAGYLEQALYYRSLSNDELNMYDAATADLIKLTTDPAYADSPARPDYFLLLGSILAQEASQAIRDKLPTGAARDAAAKATAALDQVINDPNALLQANDANMTKAQIDLLMAGEENADENYQKALDAYRRVRRKADLLVAQQQRLDDLGRRKQRMISQVAANPSLAEAINQIEFALSREQDKLDRLKEAPDSIIQALIGMAQCYASITAPDGRAESDEARTILHRLNNSRVPLTPDQQQSVDLYLVTSYVAGGQTEKADKALTDYLARHAGDPNADFISYQIATELMKRADYDGALQAARRSIRDFPKGRYVAPATTIEAQALTGLGRVAESNQVVDDFLKANPASPEAYAMVLSRAANEAAANNIPAALADYATVKDAGAAGTETQAAAAAGHIQMLARLQKVDDVMAEAKAYESRYPNGKALPVVMLFAAQALDQKSDPGAVAALQEVARKFPRDEAAPIALYGVVESYRRAGKVPLLLQAAKDLQAAYPDAYTQILPADAAAGQELRKQNKFDEAAALYAPLLKAADQSIAAEAQNKIGEIRYAQARAIHYQSLPPEQRPGAQQVLASAEQAYLATLKDFPGQLNAVGSAFDGLVSVARQRRSWGLLKDEADYEPYLSQVGRDFTSPEMQARLELAKAGLAFVVKNGAAQFPTALDRFKKVVAANPALRLDPREADQFGELLLGARDFDGAQKVYQALLNDSDANDASSLAIAYYGLGAVAMAQDDFTQAKDFFLKMKALPGGALWSAHLNDANYGIALADENSSNPADVQTAKAIYGQLMKSIQAGPGLETKALLGYGRILEREGNGLKPAPEDPNEFAVHYYQQPDLMFFTATPEQSAEGLYRAGQVYDKTGDKANAKKQYDKVIATYKDAASDWVAKAQAAETP